MTQRFALVAAVIVGLILSAARVGTQAPGPKPILYVTATAHLDSQWNWTVQDTIRQYVPDTFYTNFKYFDQYPNYTFTYEGVIHYMWFKEYHPDDWATVQKYVASGRWRLAGSWINAVDVNVPSPESLMRQALYGKRFFRQEFGKVSDDVYLPDCFGFGFALPSIARASGLSVFTTQKLTWGSSVPIPFPIGRWKGVDGSDVIAQLDPHSYSQNVSSDISVDPAWSNDLTSLGDGRQVGYRLFGTGDIGGGPQRASIDWVQKAMANKSGNVEVRLTAPEQLAHDLTPAEKAALPVYEGELTMQTHGVGCYTSQAAMKKFNRMNELLADSAERAGVAAQYVAGLAYPTERLRSAWTRMLWHQFHDDLTGTCIPQAYQFSWNDELSAANQFAGVLTSSTSAVASVLDTTGPGAPLVVYNPIAANRRDLVEATVRLPGPVRGDVVAVDAETSQIVRAQVLDTTGNDAHILFVADMPSVGYKVFNIVNPSSYAADRVPSPLTVTQTALSNERYTVSIDANGDIASIVDHNADRELLKAPIRLEMRDDPSPDKPAWRILYDTVTAPPRQYVASPIVRIAERGPARVALEITRQAAGSVVVQRVSLTLGGDRVNVETDVNWRSPNTLLKASFPFAASNPKATYDLGLGTIQRGNNTPAAYEVPAQQWADITDASGDFGAAVINDSKYGWDKPADNILRLTLIHTPLPKAYPYQSSNDLGHHRFVYAIAGHRGDWRAGQVPARAAELNQPLIAFQVDAHAGPLGHSLSMVSLDDPARQVGVVALKQAEDSDEIVVRLQERYGKVAHTTVAFDGAISSVREINAAEEPVGAFSATNGGLVVDLTPYQPRTLAVRLAPRRETTPVRTATVIPLPFNLDGISLDSNRGDGDFDGKQHTLAGELLPKAMELDGVPFTFGSSAPGAQNVLVPTGQVLSLPSGAHNHLYLLAAAVGGDVTTSIEVDGTAHPIVVREWEGAIGQWDSRLNDLSAMREPFVPSRPNGTPTTAEIRAGMMIPWDPQTFAVSPADIDKIQRGFVKRDEIAWIGTHRHAPSGNQVYAMSYLFAYAIDLPAGAREVRLPNDARIRMLAATVVNEPGRARPASALYAADIPTVK